MMEDMGNATGGEGVDHMRARHKLDAHAAVLLLGAEKPVGAAQGKGGGGGGACAMTCVPFLQ